MRIKQVMIIGVAIALLMSMPIKALTKDWYVPGSFSTIQEAIDGSSVLNGDTIFVGPGSFAGALVTKSVEIRGIGGPTINTGPAHSSSGLIMGFRLLSGSEGATISHLRFEVDLAIMNGDAINNVTVTHCTFANTIQAISNWRGSSWNITHNEIIDLRTRNGGGIGILIGDYMGGTVTDNVVAHNKISGALTSMGGEEGGYNGSGIVLYADFRWGAAGATSISFNRVVKNSVSVIDSSTLVDMVAFEMTDTRDDINAEQYPVIHDNSVGFNDFRGTIIQIDLTPEDLYLYNDISRNLGENRGQGLHPSVFKPE